MLIINGHSIELTETQLPVACPVDVSYLSTNERGAFIFRVGKREALMNIYQKRNCRKSGIDPKFATKLFLSHVNLDKGPLYLSGRLATGDAEKHRVEKEDDFEFGETVDGSVKGVVHYGLFVQVDGKVVSVLVHKNYFTTQKISNFEVGQRLTIRKIGFDKEVNHGIWVVVERRSDFLLF